MRARLQRVGIIGSGVMGSGIAAQLANAGIPSLLLDIVPKELTEEEKAKGLTLEDKAVRNRIANDNIKLLATQKPAPLFEPAGASLIEAGNMEDDFDRLAEVDWILEAAPERVDIKQGIYERIDKILKPGQIVSSNTSGISIKQMMEGRSEELKKNFLVTHFFNPPRYMRLYEVVPGPETLPEVIDRAANIGKFILGKGVVYAKDTPNFIANRIGVAEMGRILKAVGSGGYNIDEVDALTGKAIGRPKSGTFRMIDIVGLDTLINNSAYLASQLKDDPAVAGLELPDFIQKMKEKNLRGEKTGAGFYKRVKTKEGKEILTLNLETMEYGPRQKPSFPCLATAKAVDDVAARIKAVANSQDKGGELVWDILSATLVYAARNVPEISDDILNVDRAMKWGYNWELGPFEIWDALGVEETAKRLEGDGKEVPQIVRDLLAADLQSFYGAENGKPTYYNVHAKKMEPIPEREGVIEIPHLKIDPTNEVLRNEVASLLDLGDGVACIEFHCKMNTISNDTVRLIHQSLDKVEQEFDAVLIGNQGDHFSAGANLLNLVLAVEEEEWDEIERYIAEFQGTSMRFKYFSKPVIGCPHGLSLGGGCEFNLHSHRIRAAAETYMGLVECGVGLIPGGGGVKEMAIRFQEHIPYEMDVDRIPFLQKVFELIGMAKVSGSAREAQIMGLLRPSDSWSMNKDCQIHDAKQIALHMLQEGWTPLQEKPVRVMGSEGLAAIRVGLRNMMVAGWISEYDHHLGDKLAYALCGGEIAEGTMVSENYLIEREREVFLHLCGQPKTQERIRHTLKTGKPLRN
ncbi:MAG: 3-hydroxyacyl-CoA dehydrogenase/enoyl-CoA hydratase family protein [Candidatus Omnitrophica bacterium]|nr:3-hydroxyacyl-CoA dehydrogenase/enoyl-CoA hydratase family protein [Candidatus Omnitrophota bacterium]